MRTLTITGRTVAVLIATVFIASQSERIAEAAPAAPPKAAVAPTRHYCNMGVFTPAGRKRLEALVVKLVAATTERRELSNGYAFQFSGQFIEAGEWLDGVRRCCPTLDYQIEFAHSAGPALLRITGGAGAKEFIQEEFKVLFQKTDGAATAPLHQNGEQP